MTTTHKRAPARRRLDVAGAVLTVIGVVCGILAYWLITNDEANALVIVPGTVAATIGLSHLVKREAPRD